MKITLFQTNQDINPLVTNPKADNYWKEKRDRVQKLGIKFLAMPRKRVGSTEIIDKLLSET